MKKKTLFKCWIGVTIFKDVRIIFSFSNKGENELNDCFGID